MADHVQTLCNYAWLQYEHKENPKKAEQFLARALAIEPNNPDALHMVCIYVYVYV
jgi:hypothetical protein